MSDAASQWVAALRAQPLPLPQASKAAYAAQVNNRARPLTELVERSCQDAVLSTRVIGEVNRLRRNTIQDVSALDVAFGMLGASRLADLIEGIPTVENAIPTPAGQFHYRRLLLRTSHAAQQTLDWGHSIGDPAPLELALATLTYHVAELALCAQQTSRYLGFLRELETANDWQAAGESHFDASLAAIAQAWVSQPQIPESIRFILAVENSERYRAQLVRLASECARASEYGWSNEALWQCQTTAAEVLGQPLARITAGCAQTSLMVARARAEADLTPAATFIPMLPSYVPLIESEEAAAPVDPALTAQAPVPATTELTATSKPVRAEPILIRLQAQVGTAAILRALAHGLRDDLDLPRIALFLLLDNQLQLRLSLGVAKQAPLYHLTLAFDDCRLCQQLLTQPQAYWLQPAEFAQEREQLEPQLRTALESDTVFFMSLFIGARPMALLLADKHGEPLSNAQFIQFKRLCPKVTDHLSKTRQK